MPAFSICRNMAIYTSLLLVNNGYSAEKHLDLYVEIWYNKNMERALIPKQNKEKGCVHHGKVQCRRYRKGV